MQAKDSVHQQYVSGSVLCVFVAPQSARACAPQFTNTLLHILNYLHGLGCRAFNKTISYKTVLDQQIINVHCHNKKWCVKTTVLKNIAAAATAATAAAAAAAQQPHP